MSELSRSHTADIADTRFAAAIRGAGRLAVRAMSGYGMAACGAKRTIAEHDRALTGLLDGRRAMGGVSILFRCLLA